MMNYADSTYYKDTYKGEVIDTSSVNFDKYAIKATQTIIKYTFNRVDENNVPDDVKMCCCELAEHIYLKDTAEVETEADKKSITSETTGGYTAHYEASADRELANIAAVEKIINDWLLMTGLLYRGNDYVY